MGGSTRRVEASSRLRPRTRALARAAPRAEPPRGKPFKQVGSDLPATRLIDARGSACSVHGSLQGGEGVLVGALKASARRRPATEQSEGAQLGAPTKQA